MEIELKYYELKILGRNYQQSLSINASREHCIIFLDEKDKIPKIIIADISTNGTYVKLKKGQETLLKKLAVYPNFEELEYVKIGDEKIFFRKKKKVIYEFLIGKEKLTETKKDIEYVEQGLFIVSKNAYNANEQRRTGQLDEEINNPSKVFGWKFHIFSFDLLDYMKLLKAAIPFLDKNNYAYKFVHPLDIIDFNKDPESRARLLTVYPLNVNEFKKACNEINAELIKNGLKMSAKDLKILDNGIVEESGSLVVKKDGKLKEKMVKFVGENSNRIFYRNELFVEGNRLRYDGGEGRAHVFNYANAPNPFEKEDSTNNNPIKNAVNNLAKKK